MTNPSTPPLNRMRHATLCAGLLAASLVQAQAAPTYEMRVMVQGLKPAGGPAGTAPPVVVTPPAPALVPALAFQNDAGDVMGKLVFPDTPVGGISVAQRVVLANFGTAPLVFDSSPVATSPFEVSTSNCPSSLAPGLACDVTVRFSPQAQQAYAGGAYTLATSSNVGLRNIELEGVGIVLVRISSLAYGGLAGASQARVPVQGGVVTLTGAGFNSSSTVSLANGDAITPSSVSETSLTFQAPAGTAGSQLTVAVRTGAQQFEINQGLAYVVPALAVVSPSTGDINGNLVVTLSGSGFLPGASVKFGNSSATGVVVAADGASLTARTPPATSPGAVSVTVTNPGGTTATKSAGFTYALATQNVAISSSVGNYNLKSALGNPTVAKQFVVTISAGTLVTSNSTSTAAFDTGALPAGSTVKIVNNGAIIGKGGNGGYSSAGASGGTAIYTFVPLTVDNTNGYVLGGGGGGGAASIICGGGGAGGGSSGSGPDAYYGQAGTGGINGSGGAGNRSNGYSMYGGNGGEYGASGTRGTDAYGQTHHAGGAAGKAVLGGQTITWLGGNTAAKVKGAVN